MTHPDLQGAVERLTAVAVDLDYAAIPTKPDVFVACGSVAGQIRDDLRLVLSSLSRVEETAKYLVDLRGRAPTPTESILQALQGSSLRDPHRATEQPVVGDWIEWTGGENPAPGRMVQYRAHGITSGPTQSERVVWNGAMTAVTAYRLADSGEAALGGGEAEGGVNQDLQAQLKAAYEALDLFRAAVSWLDAPFVTEGTLAEELRKRIRFMHDDIVRAEAKLQPNTERKGG